MLEMIQIYWAETLAVLSVVFGTVAATHAAMTKREVRSALGWVGVIILSPLVGAMIYAVAGINLFSLKGRRFRIGQALLETTGWCQPCARLEERLGRGTFQAMRGHGGITARVIEGGIIRLEDAVSVEILAPLSDPQDNDARQGWRARLAGR